MKPISEFNRNVVTLMTGTTVAQAIPIAISPILTRIYSPENFGVFTVFMAIVGILAPIANARYEVAIMLPERDDDAINIFALGLLITSALTIFLFIGIFFSQELIVTQVSNDIGPWLYLIPISVFFIGIFNVLSYFNIRKRYYKDMASAKIFKATAMAVIQVSMGFLKQGVSGLISGQIISQTIANFRLVKNLFEDKEILSRITKERMWGQAKKHKNFPKFSLWAALLNSLSIHLSNVLISLFFSVSTLGFYSLVYRVLGTPSALIGGSIGQVFYQQATVEKGETGGIIEVYKKTLKKLIVVGIPVYGLFYFIIEDLFAIVFGNDWRIAGSYARIVMPLFFFRFIFVSVSTTFTIFNRMDLELFLKALLLIGVVTILILSKGQHFERYLYYFMYYSSLVYLGSLLISYRIVKARK